MTTPANALDITQAGLVNFDGTTTFTGIPPGSNLNLLQSTGSAWVSTAPIWRTGTHTLTNSEIKNLHATPIELIAAPGSGKGLLLASVTARLNYGGNNAFTAGAAQTIALYYNNTSLQVTPVNPFFPNAMITATANKFSVGNFSYGASYQNQVAGVLDNVNVALYNSVATEISGNVANDNTIDVQVIYSIVTF